MAVTQAQVERFYSLLATKRQPNMARFLSIKVPLRAKEGYVFRARKGQDGRISLTLYFSPGHEKWETWFAHALQGAAEIFTGRTNAAEVALRRPPSLPVPNTHNPWFINVPNLSDRATEHLIAIAVQFNGEVKIPWQP